MKRWAPWARAASVGLGHRRRLDPAVEIFCPDEAERKRRFAQRRAVAMRLERDLRRVLVADVRVECGDEHERLLDVALDARAVRLDAARTALVERPDAIGQELGRLERVVQDD